VGGVVAETGPQPLAVLPDRVSLYTADSELPVADLAVPGAPRLVAVGGAAAATGMRVGTQEPLAVTVAGAAGGFIELRPFGATVAVACLVPPGTAGELVVTVPRALLAEVAAGSPAAAGQPVAASLDVARRNHLRQWVGAPSTRLSVEVRASMTVELRP
jgi:hypothetical protein